MNLIDRDVLWSDTLLWPAYAAGLSVIILALTLIFESLRGRKADTNDVVHLQEAEGDHDHEAFSWATYAQGLGGPVIVAFQILRLISCATLAILTTVPVLQNVAGRSGQHEVIHILYDWLPHITLCATYVSSFLSVIPGQVLT